VFLCFCGKRFKDSKIQGFKRFGTAYAGKGFKKSLFVHSWLKEFKDSKDSKIQKFNPAKTGIGFQKYSVAFCVSVFSRRQNIRAFVAKRFKNSRIQRFKDSKDSKIQKFKDSSNDQ